MTISLPPELEQFVQQEIAGGKYRSADELVHAAVHLLKTRQSHVERLRQEVQRGEGIELDENSLKTFFADIESEAHRRIASSRQAPP